MVFSSKATCSHIIPYPSRPWHNHLVWPVRHVYRFITLLKVFFCFWKMSITVTVSNPKSKSALALTKHTSFQESKSLRQLSLQLASHTPTPEEDILLLVPRITGAFQEDQKTYRRQGRPQTVWGVKSCKAPCWHLFYCSPSIETFNLYWNPLYWNLLDLQLLVESCPGTLNSTLCLNPRSGAYEPRQETIINQIQEPELGEENRGGHKSTDWDMKDFRRKPIQSETEEARLRQTEKVPKIKVLGEWKKHLKQT